MSAAPFSHNDARAFVEHLFLVQAFTGNEATFNFPSWSISTELYTYLIFAVAIMTLSRRAFVWFAATLAGGCMLLLVVYDQRVMHYGMMLRCAGGFFLGCVTCVVFRRTTAAAWKPNPTALVGLAFASLWLLEWEDSVTTHAATLLPSALLIFALVIAPASNLNRALSSKPLIWLGKISYSLYMSHAFVLWTAKQVSRALFRGREAAIDGAIGWLLPAPIAALAYAAAFAAVLVTAWLTHHFVEEPFRKASRRWSAGRVTAEPAVAAVDRRVP